MRAIRRAAAAWPRQGHVGVSRSAASCSAVNVLRRERVAVHNTRRWCQTVAQAAEAKAAGADVPSNEAEEVIKARIDEFEKEDTEFDPKVVEIVDKICELNLKEVTDLTLALRERLNLSPQDMGLMGGGVMMGGGMMMPQGQVPGAAAPAEEEEAEPEKTHFDLQLDGWDAKDKIKIIKEVRAITGLGLKEAKALVEDAPKVVKKEIKKDEGDELIAKLEAVNAKVSLV